MLGVEKMLHLLCAKAHGQAWQTLPNGSLLSPKHKPQGPHAPSIGVFPRFPGSFVSPGVQQVKLHT
jgi:hypothetical protein